MDVNEKKNLPRERLEKNGPEALSTADLLALVLGRGTAAKNVFDLAAELTTFLSAAARRPTLEENLFRAFRGCRLVPLKD